MPPGYYDDWVKAADEESKHFNLLVDHLGAMGSNYGAFPTHAGLWRAAQDTAEDFMGRLAILPMVLEARRIDVTPNMIQQFKSFKDKETVARSKLSTQKKLAMWPMDQNGFTVCVADTTKTQRSSSIVLLNTISMVD